MGARVVARPFGSKTHRHLLSTGKVRKTVIPENGSDRAVQIDVRRDSDGEYFDVRYHAGQVPEVLDVSREGRHLVVMVRDQNEKQKYLCGHDERHWFVAAVPGANVKDVASAKAALRPDIPDAIRQGEWFFVPEPGLKIESNWRNPIHRNEPLSRGGNSKPHTCEEIYRRGGIVTMVSRKYPNGISKEAMDELVAETPEARTWGWRAMTRDAEVFARGYVRHADHATIHLEGWHRVYLNQERLASWSTNVVFLD